MAEKKDVVTTRSGLVLKWNEKPPPMVGEVIDAWDQGSRQFLQTLKYSDCPLCKEKDRQILSLTQDISSLVQFTNTLGMQNKELREEKIVMAQKIEELTQLMVPIDQ